MSALIIYTRKVKINVHHKLSSEALATIWFCKAALFVRAVAAAGGGNKVCPAANQKSNEVDQKIQ